MISTTDLPDYPTVPPRDPLRKLALRGINLIFRWRGLKFPPYFCLRDRMGVLRNGIEPEVQGLCSRLLREGMMAVDVGANIGFLTRQFCRRVGSSGKVFAFEPDPLNFRFLEFNTRFCKNVRLMQCAVSDNHEPALLHLNSGSGTGNSLVNKTQSTESVPVSCISLDEFLNSCGNPAVNLVKIDVEGAELNVLRGIRHTIRRLPDLQIVIEYCPNNLRGAGIEPRAIYDELKAGDFGIGAIQKSGLVKDVAAFDDLESLLNRQGYVNLLCARGKPR